MPVTRRFCGGSVGTQTKEGEGPTQSFFSLLRSCLRRDATWKTNGGAFKLGRIYPTELTFVTCKRVILLLEGGKDI